MIICVDALAYVDSESDHEITRGLLWRLMPICHASSFGQHRNKSDLIGWSCGKNISAESFYYRKLTRLYHSYDAYPGKRNSRVDRMSIGYFC